MYSGIQKVANAKQRPPGANYFAERYFIKKSDKLLEMKPSRVNHLKAYNTARNDLFKGLDVLQRLEAIGFSQTLTNNTLTHTTQGTLPFPWQQTEMVMK